MIRNGQLNIVTNAMENSNIEIGLILRTFLKILLEMVNSISQLYKDNNCDSIVAMGRFRYRYG